MLVVVGSCCNSPSPLMKIILRRYGDMRTRLHLECSASTPLALEHENLKIKHISNKYSHARTQTAVFTGSERAGQANAAGSSCLHQDEGEQGATLLGQAAAHQRHMAKRGGGGSKAAPGLMFPSPLMPKRAPTHCSKARTSSQLPSQACAQHLSLSCLCLKVLLHQSSPCPRFCHTQVHSATAHTLKKAMANCPSTAVPPPKKMEQTPRLRRSKRPSPWSGLETAQAKSRSIKKHPLGYLPWQ